MEQQVNTTENATTKKDALVRLCISSNGTIIQQTTFTENDMTMLFKIFFKQLVLENKPEPVIAGLSTKDFLVYFPEWMMEIYEYESYEKYLELLTSFLKEYGSDRNVFRKNREAYFNLLKMDQIIRHRILHLMLRNGNGLKIRTKKITRLNKNRIEKYRAKTIEGLHRFSKSDKSNPSIYFPNKHLEENERSNALFSCRSGNNNDMFQIGLKYGDTTKPFSSEETLLVMEQTKINGNYPYLFVTCLN